MRILRMGDELVKHFLPSVVFNLKLLSNSSNAVGSIFFFLSSRLLGLPLFLTGMPRIMLKLIMAAF